mgnify:CR=1 FL=1
MGKGMMMLGNRRDQGNQSEESEHDEHPNESMADEDEFPF